jgi:hypothetical protein
MKIYKAIILKYENTLIAVHWRDAVILTEKIGGASVILTEKIGGTSVILTEKVGGTWSS